MCPYMYTLCNDSLPGTLSISLFLCGENDSDICDSVDGPGGH